MRPSLKVLFILALSLSTFYDAWSARRVAQFAGMSAAEFDSGMIHNQNYTAICQVVIVNVGATNQLIESVQFMSAGATTAWDTNITVLGRKSTAGNIDDCVGTSAIPPYGFCVARYLVSTISNTNLAGICAGRITVVDSAQADPGKVVASGSITMFQESIVFGGQLSGALYQSPPATAGDPGPGTGSSELQGFVGGATSVEWFNEPAAPTGIGAGLLDSKNMNVYCTYACRADPFPNQTTIDKCNDICGFKDLQGERGLAEPRNIQQMATAGSPASVDSVLTTTNSYYAGGMVYEMTLGPSNSICSANPSYWNNGGSEFLHPDYYHNWVDSSQSMAGAPPERLFCSHRHSRDELVMRTGDTVGFSINGGNAF